MDAIVSQPAVASRKINFSAAPIQFDFDFFDLEIIPGLYANGTAEIAVHADGVNDDPEYFIGRISLQGAWNGSDHTMHEVEGNPEFATNTERLIYRAIFDALDSGSLSEKVKDRMVQEIGR